MKKYFLFFIILLGFIGKSQEYPMPLIIEGKPTDAQYGLAKDMVYETILETNLSQKDLISKIGKGLVEMGFVHQKDLKTDAITNKQKRVVIKGGFKAGTFAGKGKSMISKRLKSPAVLIFDIVFDFYESGKVKIQFTNFDEMAFIRINSIGQFHFEPSMAMNPSAEPSDDRHAKLQEIEGNVMKLGTGLGKAMSFIEKGHADMQIKISADGVKVTTNNGIKDDMIKLRTEIDEEWKVLDKAVEDKIAIWINPKDKDFVNLYPTITNKQKEQKALYEKRSQENVLLVIDNDRFDRYYKDLFNQVFLWSAIELKGKVLGIAKDGKIIYSVNENYELKEAK